MNDFDRKRRVSLMAEAIRTSSLVMAYANYGQPVDGEGVYETDGKPEPFLARYRRGISERCAFMAKVSFAVGEPVEADELRKAVMRLEPDVTVTTL